MKTQQSEPIFAGSIGRTSLTVLVLLLFIAAFPVWGKSTVERFRVW